MPHHSARDAAKFYEERLGVPRPLVMYRYLMGFPKHSLGATTLVNGEYGYQPFDMPGVVRHTPVKKPVKITYK